MSVGLILNLASKVTRK